MNSKYFVYTAIYEQAGKSPKGHTVYEVTMIRSRALEATTASAAMAEAKRIGYVAPMVGQ